MNHSLTSIEEMVDANGWAFITRDCDPLLSFASRFGVPIPSHEGGSLVDELLAKRRDEASEFSLSGKYGMEAFPFHTDCAHFAVPPRYLLLESFLDNESSAATVLVDSTQLQLSDVEQNHLRIGVWSVTPRLGQKPFIANVLNVDVQSGRTFVRYDQMCMTPINQIALDAHTSFMKSLTRAKVIRIDWKERGTLIVDNWRMIHGREAISEMNAVRRLRRVLLA